ncbi:ribonuclease P protein subunit POP4 [Fusarium austroafricanum]|uniref:Ribonuclease P protein subunit n=1 Tax=Fusarium austroafricanum TaxID=2364996 RepID=A0A8H4KBA5_9HYPO|nr:ribonuclease P protein subunit POP4 [Fusarium austroafricanum]
MASTPQQATQNLLARAHSPDSVNRIYSEKIQHRTLILRPTSPPPATINARAARRKARQDKKEKQKQRPKPLSSREKRSLGLHDIPKDGQKYHIYEPLSKLWLGYARELLGNDISTGGPSAAVKLASAEFHGAPIQVVRSHCPSRVGIQGVVVRDHKFVFEIVTKKRGVKVVPKEGTIFRVEVPAEGEVTSGEQGSKKIFACEVLGDQMMLRAPDRANKKFKAHFLPNI